MKLLRNIALTATFITTAPNVMADEYSLMVGPAASGGGGPNPLGLPVPSLPEWQATWVRTSGKPTEWVVGIIPGIFYGWRSSSGPGPYASIGPGLVVHQLGIGPGISAAFGAQFFCGAGCMQVEYRQALGIAGFGAGSQITPYSLRIGYTYFN